MSTQYVFEIAHPSGEVYAVRHEADGTITGACGPLSYREVHADDLANYDYDEELGEWMMSEEFAGLDSNRTLRPLTADEVANIESQAATNNREE